VHVARSGNPVSRSRNLRFGHTAPACTSLAVTFA
jgi:hypothetical protein